MKILRLLLMMIPLVFNKNLFTYDFNKQGKEYANSLNTKFGGIGGTTDPQSVVPQYKGADVPETKYYKSGSSFENMANTDAKKDETYSYLKEASDKRPSVKIDPQKDPLFKRYDEITKESHSLSETYQGCKKLPVGTNDITKYSKKSCFEYGERDEITFQCDKKLEINCKNDNAGQFVPFGANAFTVTGPSFPKKEQKNYVFFGSETNDRMGTCTAYKNTISFNLKNLEEVVAFNIFKFTFDDWITISLNDKTLYSEPFVKSKCERAYNFSNPGIDLKPYLKIGNNTITIVNTVAGGGHAWIPLIAVKKPPCEVNDNIIYNCDNNQNHLKAKLSESRCIEGPRTRRIKGTAVFRECWRWVDTFNDVDRPIYTKEPLCDELVQTGCGFVSSSCIDGDSTYCKKREYVYSCPNQESEKYVEICGDQLVCPDGNCTKEYQEYKPSTEDLKKAVTAMEVANLLSRELKEDRLSVFKGGGKKCKVDVLGYKNCCKDKGWGVGAGLTHCTSDEKELGMAKEAGRAHYIGNYRTGKLLNRKTFQSYCTYPTKLARIIIEQGKGQLGRGFGSPESPDCSGINLNELEKIDFDKMNFSEFESEVLNKIGTGKMPGATSSVEKFKASIQQKIKKGKN